MMTDTIEEESADVLAERERCLAALQEVMSDMFRLELDADTALRMVEDAIRSGRRY